MLSQHLLYTKPLLSLLLGFVPNMLTFGFVLNTPMLGFVPNTLTFGFVLNTPMLGFVPNTPTYVEIAKLIESLFMNG